MSSQNPYHKQRACCKPQVNARFVNQELVEVWKQHFGFTCEVRRENIDPKDYAPTLTHVTPRVKITPSEHSKKRRDREWTFGSLDNPHDKSQGLKGKRQFTGDRRSKANQR